MTSITKNKNCIIKYIRIAMASNGSAQNVKNKKKSKKVKMSSKDFYKNAKIYKIVDHTTDNIYIYRFNL